MVWNIPLFILSQLSQLCVLPTSCIPPAYLLSQRVQNQKLWHCASTVQQEQKHWCVTNTIVVINLKQSTVWVAMKKINFQPRPLQSSLLISYQLCTIRYILINHNSSCCPVVYTWIFFPWSVSHPLKMSIRCSFSYLVHVLGYTYYVVA